MVVAGGFFFRNVNVLVVWESCIYGYCFFPTALFAELAINTGFSRTTVEEFKSVSDVTGERGTAAKTADTRETGGDFESVVDPRGTHESAELPGGEDAGK